VEGLAEALRVWPADEAIAEEFRGAFVETPVLDVAVLDIPRGLGPWERTAAEKRLARLVYLPLLAEDSEEAVKGGRDDQLVAGIEATELGRRVRIAIRDGAKWSDGSRGLSAVDVARSLADRALPEAPGYQARWAELLDGVSPAGARDVELRLSRAPLDLEKWLLGPVGPAHSGRDGRVWTDEGTKLVGSGPYTPAGENGPTLRLDRVAGEGGSAWPIARIHERPYGDPDAAVGALLRGDVQLLEEVPPRRLQELTGTAGVKVGKYEAPRMHWIAVDGRNPALRNRSLRRGISFAIDRASLLHDFALGRSPEGADSPSDGPFPAGSYANAPEVPPLEFDPLLSRLLVTAARTELGGDRINLKFEYPASAVARSVVPEIVEALEATGLAITPVERPADDLERELRLGRRFDLAYRVAPVEDAVTEAGPLLCPGYDSPESTDGLGAIASPRMLQLLLELERAPDWPTARALVLQLDLEARDELPVIPLWQMGHHRAWRDQLSGVPEVVDRLYQGIETWSLAPWTPDPAN
jgi:peptide/nickel transport system substrate-binding protein